MKLKVKEQINSRGKGRQLYCLAGEVVTLIAKHGEALIVETTKGLRFPIHKTKCDELKD